jgi:SAM-dependent methyltransferase
MLSVARRADAGAALVESAAESLPFADGAFDLILLSMVLHHLKGSAAALAELARVARPGGILFIRAPSFEERHGYLWMGFFPEAAAMEASRLLPPAEIEAMLPGFRLLRRRTVTQLFAADPRAYCAKIAERTLSSLSAIPDAAFANGLAALEQYCDAAPDSPVYEPVEMMVFERRRAA